MTTETNKINTWQEALQSFYANWLHANIKNKYGYAYGSAFLESKFIEARKALETNDRNLINNMWRTNKCSYCKRTLTVKDSEGDHIVAILREWGNDDFSIPCCTDLDGCNSSKGDLDCLEWWTKTHALTDLDSKVLFVYLRAQHFVKKTLSLLNERPDEVFLKHLQTLENLNNIQMVESQEFGNRQEQIFSLLKSIKSDWRQVMPDSIEEDSIGYPIPRYGVLPDGYSFVYPMSDLNPKYLDISDEPDHCQLCGTEIKRIWIIANDSMKLFLEIGSECFKNYFNDGEDPIQAAFNHLIKQEFLIWKSNNNEMFWKKWGGFGFRSKTQAWGFFTELNNVDEQTDYKTVIRLLRFGIQSGFIITTKLAKMIPITKQKKLWGDLLIYGSDIKSEVKT